MDLLQELKALRQEFADLRLAASFVSPQPQTAHPDIAALLRRIGSRDPAAKNLPKRPFGPGTDPALRLVQGGSGTTPSRHTEEPKPLRPVLSVVRPSPACTLATPQADSGKLGE